MSLTGSSNTDLRNLIYFSDELEDRGVEFEPVTYKLVSCNAGKKDVNLAQPPKWVLLDHTIAVVWSLFNSFYNYQLDIEDLRWAHEFLKDIRNSKGEIPPDVKACLEAIQERMISLYAKLVPTKEGNQREEEIPCEEEQMIFTRKKIHNSEARKESVQPEVAELREVKSGISDGGENRKSGTKDTALRDLKKTVYGVSKRTTSTPKTTPPASKKEPPRRELTPKKQDVAAVSDNFLKGAERRAVSDSSSSSSGHIGRRKAAASLHEEQLTRDTSDLKDSFENPLDSKKISLQFRRFITPEESNNEEQAYRNLKNEIWNLTKNSKIPKEQVLNFLSDWREVHIERFQSELKRLCSVEKFLKSVNEDGFVPYLEEDLTQRLESLAKKNAKKNS